MKATHLLLALGAASLLSASGVEARERGKPGTDERKAYCNAEYADCLSGGVKACDKEYPNDARKAADCQSASDGACRAYFIGPNSPCRTKERVTPWSGVIGPRPPTTIDPKAPKPKRELPR
jgi:hypothetical protein